MSWKAPLLFFIIIFFSKIIYCQDTQKDNFLAIKESYLAKEYSTTLSLIDQFSKKDFQTKVYYYKDIIFLIKGETLFRLGDYENSIIAFKELIKEFPKSPLASKALFSIGCAYFQQQKYQEALDSFDQLLNEYPDVSESKEAQYWIAEAYYALGQYENAIKFYLNTIAFFPDHIRAVKAAYYTGICYYYLKEYDETVHYMDEVLSNAKAEDFYLLALHTKANALGLMKQFDKALAVYDVIIEKYKELGMQDKIGGIILEKASLLFYKLENFDKVIEILNDFFKENSKDIYADEALYMIALSYFRQNNFLEAIAGYDKLIEKYPQSVLNIDAKINKGICLYNLKKYKEAVIVYDQVIQNNSEKAWKAFYNKAWAYLQLGKEKEAVDIFEEITKKFPQHSLVPDIFLWLADYYSRKGNDERAEECLKIIINKYSSSKVLKDAYVELAQLTYLKGDVEESLLLFDKIEPLDPMYFEVQLMVIDIFLIHARYEAVLNKLQILEKNKIDSTINQQIKYRFGQVYFLKKEWNKALDFFEQSKYGPHNKIFLQSLMNQGEIYMCLHDWKKALDKFKEVMNKTNSKASLDIFCLAKLNAGKCFEKLGEKESACFFYKEIYKENYLVKYAVIAKERMRLIEEL